MIPFVLLFGAVIGSFLNVLIDRLPKGEDILWYPSHCDFCKKKLRWFELIPLLSFVLQSGRCRRCRNRLSWQYPIIELTSAIAFILLFPYPLYIVVFCAMLVIFVIDWKHQIIPDSMLLILFLGSTIIRGIGQSQLMPAFFAGLGFLFLWLVTRGKGLGFGDVKLVAVLGLLLGYPGIIIALYTAFLTGAIYGVILIVAHRAKLKSRIAFGPFLIIGALVSLVWGETLWQLWRRML